MSGRVDGIDFRDPGRGQGHGAGGSARRHHPRSGCGHLAFALAGALVFDGRGLGFVLFVLQILGFLPPHLSRDRTGRVSWAGPAAAPAPLDLGELTSLSFSGIAFHTSASFLLSSPNTAGQTNGFSGLFSFVSMTTGGFDPPSPGCSALMFTLYSLQNTW